MNFTKYIFTVSALLVGLVVATPSDSRRAPVIDLSVDAPVPGKNVVYGLGVLIHIVHSCNHLKGHFVP